MAFIHQITQLLHFIVLFNVFTRAKLFEGLDTLGLGQDVVGASVQVEGRVFLLDFFDVRNRANEIERILNLAVALNHLNCPLALAGERLICQLDHLIECIIQFGLKLLESRERALIEAG